MDCALAPAAGFAHDDVIALLAVGTLGGTLSWLSLYYPTELPVWAPWDFSWVEFLSAALGLW